MISLFGSTRELHAFAEDLAQQIAKRYPPALDQDASKRPSVNRLTRIIEDACGKSVDFQRQKRLGWIAKARLGNHFRWCLVEAGYRKEFAEFATEAVVVYMSRPTSGTPKSDPK